jgi:hypothetical protein
MVDKPTTSQRSVIDFLSYQQARRDGTRAMVASAIALSARSCKHCGAALAEGESEDECSSAFNVTRLPPPRFRATPER